MARRTGKAVTDNVQDAATVNEIQGQLQTVIETNAPIIADAITEQTVASAFLLVKGGYCGPKTKALFESFGGTASPLGQWGEMILEASPEASLYLTESTT